MNRHELDAICNIAGTDRDRLSPPNGRSLTARRPRARRDGVARRGRADADLGTHTGHSPVATRIERNALRGAEPQPDGAENGLGVPVPTRRLVLLATGDDRFLSAGHDYLMDQGYDVVTATGGVECVAMLRGFIPDVVVLDADLLWGGADGVLARLRSGIGTHIPVVFLAPPADAPPTYAKAVNTPVASVLMKPVILASLSRAVRSAAGCGISSGRGG